MLLRIVAVAAALIAMLIAVKDHRVLQRAHVVGSCATVLKDADGSEWRSCVAGTLSGRPDLSRSGCTDAGPRGSTEFWHCPASVAEDVVR